MEGNTSIQGIQILEEYFGMPWLPHDQTDISDSKHLIYTHPGFPWADAIDAIHKTQVQSKAPQGKADGSWAQEFPNFFEEGKAYEFKILEDIRKISAQILEMIAKLSPGISKPEAKRSYASSFPPEEILLRNRIMRASGTLREMIREALMLTDILSTDNLVTTMCLAIPTLDPATLKDTIANPGKSPTNNNTFLFTKHLLDQAPKQGKQRFIVTSSYYAPEHNFHSKVFPQMGFVGPHAAPEKPDEEHERQVLWEQYNSLTTAAFQNPEVYLTGSYVDQCCAHTLSDIYTMYGRIKFPFNLGIDAFVDSPQKTFVDPRLQKLLARLAKAQDLEATRKIVANGALEAIFPIDNSRFFLPHVLKDQHMFRERGQYWNRVDLSSTRDLKAALA